MVNAWLALTALVVALAAAWIVYRIQRREERDTVLTALVAELELHESWVGHGGWPPGSWLAGMGTQWWGDPPDWNKVVFKLSTTATDHAILLIAVGVAFAAPAVAFVLRQHDLKIHRELRVRRRARSHGSRT